MNLAIDPFLSKATEDRPDPLSNWPPVTQGAPQTEDVSVVAVAAAVYSVILSSLLPSHLALVVAARNHCRCPVVVGESETDR